VRRSHSGRTCRGFLVFIMFWSLLVYNPVARWSWHWAGWSNKRGVMHFAGGTLIVMVQCDQGTICDDAWDDGVLKLCGSISRGSLEHAAFIEPIDIAS